MDTLYKDLGLKPVINASATLTRLGGSRMPEEVLQAMTAAAGSFIDLNALQERVGARIAELTNNEACYCLLYTSPSPRDKRQSRMPSSA